MTSITRTRVYFYLSDDKVFLRANFFVSNNMNFNDIIDLERGTRSALIEWLQRRHLLPDPLHCAQCNQAMELKQRNDDTWMAFYGTASLFALFKKSSESSCVVVRARMNSVAAHM